MRGAWGWRDAPRSSRSALRPTPEYLALEASYTRQLKATVPTLRQRVEALVYDTWQLEWPWLVFELLDHYQRVLTSLITGDGWAGTFGQPPATLPTAPAPEPGESRGACLRRIRDYYPKLSASREREGVRVNPERIARDVRVLYRLRLKRPLDTIYTVAKTERLSPWQTKQALARAIKLLSDPVPRLPRLKSPK